MKYSDLRTDCQARMLISIQYITHFSIYRF